MRSECVDVDVVVGDAVDDHQLATQARGVWHEVGVGVRVGLLLRRTQIALGVVRVVQTHVADRSARDACMEHVRSSEQGGQRQVSPVGPAADRDALQVEEREALGRRPESFDLVRRAPHRCSRGTRPDPRQRPGTGCRGRRSRARRTPGRRTTATPGASVASRWTRPKCGPPYGSSNTGSLPSGPSAGVRLPGTSSAVRSSFGPSDAKVGLARRVGVSARRSNVWIGSSPRSRVAVGRASSSLSATSTVRSPPTTASCTPTSWVNRSS